MATRGYSSYHGRRGGRRFAAVAVLLVVFLCAVGYLVLQNFIVYESDGSVRLELPFFEKDEMVSSEDELIDTPPVEILPGEEQAGESKIDALEIRAGSVSAAALCRDSMAQLNAAADAGFTAMVIPVKGDNGVYHYTSPLAKTKALDEHAVSQTLLQTTLEETGLRKIAQLSCFHDSFFAFSDMAGTGICQSSGYIWYDNQSSYWLEPSKSAAREYLCTVARECVDMGFEELLLTEFTYPTQGKLDKIDYSSMTMSKEEALETFLEELRAVVGEEIALSVAISEEVILAGHDSVAGIDLERLLPLVDRVYVSAVDRAGVLAALETAGAADAQAITVWMEEGTFLSAFAENK